MMTNTFINPSSEQITAIGQMDLEGPVVMLNLLRFAPDGGAKSYAKYAQAAQPFLEKVGASVRFMGSVETTVIGGEEWDEVVLVEYPSKQAFLAMIGDPGYPHKMRADALLDSRLYCTRRRTPP